MTIFGLPLATGIAFFAPIVVILIGCVFMVMGKYEGKKVEEEYGVEEWYRTF